jgi:hypothetical protein
VHLNLYLVDFSRREKSGERKKKQLKKKLLPLGYGRVIQALDKGKGNMVALKIMSTNQVRCALLAASRKSFLKKNSC